MSSDDLFFYAAKIFGWFLRIDNLLLLGNILTIFLFWTKRIRIAKRATLAVALVFALFSNLGMSFAALRTLEDEYPIPAISCEDGYEGVIILGGGINPGLIPEQRGQTQLNEAGERITKALELLNKCPDFKALYSTFSGSLRPEGWSESDSARLFFQDQRVPAARLIFEDRSRNTFENAKLSLDIVGSKERWVLVTSASHMPRAMDTFTRFGWDVTPYPVDFRSEVEGKYFDFSRETAIRNWNNAIHEWVGAIAYRLRSV